MLHKIVIKLDNFLIIFIVNKFSILKMILYLRGRNVPEWMMAWFILKNLSWSGKVFLDLNEAIIEVNPT